MIQLLGVLLFLLLGIVFFISWVMAVLAAVMFLFDNELLRLLFGLAAVFSLFVVSAMWQNGRVRGILNPFSLFPGGVMALGGVQLLSGGPWTVLAGVLAILSSLSLIIAGIMGAAQWGQ